MLTFENWEARFKAHIQALQESDPAHDLAHFIRVSTTAKNLAQEEGAKLEVVLPAAWLHDLVNVPKNDPRRSQASRLSAEAALQLLREMNYPEEHFDGIAHAIEAHSFSAGISPETLEAQIVQDADRLDGLGAIGIARCFAVSGMLKRKLYHPTDLFGQTRKFDDLEYAVDHFFVKLFKVADSLKTPAGRAEGQRRARFMRDFLTQLEQEVFTK
ncbi:HD domain-containing protein [bacterium]|nr:HD domain-containing protein [bacterium]